MSQESLIISKTRNNKTSKKRQRNLRQMRRRNNGTSYMRPLRVLVEPGDQTAVFKRVGRFAIIESNQGYFYGVQVIQPYGLLRTSPYAGLVDIYEQCRVVKYSVKCWLPGASLNTPGSTVAKLYRDYPAGSSTNNPTYEALLQERLMKQGRAHTLYYFNWIPIEATDFDFLPINENIDNGRFGKIDMAGIALPTITDDFKPYYEISMTIDFKYLRKQVGEYQDQFEHITITSPRPSTAQFPQRRFQ